MRKRSSCAKEKEKERKETEPRSSKMSSKISRTDGKHDAVSQICSQQTRLRDGYMRQQAKLHQ